MRQQKSLVEKVTFYASVLAFFVCVSAPGLALAAPDTTTPAPEPAANLWLVGYAITGLGITLGMLALCRSARRSDRAKPQEYKGLTTNE